MEERRSRGFGDVGAAARALIVAAWCAVPIALVTGIGIGLLFYVVGALFALVFAPLFGFLAALFGGACGGRAGWVLGPFLAPFVVAASLFLLPSGHGSFMMIVALYAAISAALAAPIAGIYAGRQCVRHPRERSGRLGRICDILDDSPLYSFPLSARLAIAAVIALPVIGLFLLLVWRIGTGSP